MPELPDLVRFKKYIDSTSLHQKIKKTHIGDTRILGDISRRAIQRRLKRAQLTATDRYGKFLLVELSGGSHLVLHFGMTGNLTYYVKGKPPPHTRLLVDFENGGHLAYQSQRILGEVGLTEKMENFLRQRKLGPDALDEHFTERDFVDRLSNRRGSLKSALMNQSIIAGIGNVYSDEILFQARLHPGTKLTELSREDLSGIYGIMRWVMKISSQGYGDPDRLPDNFLLPYRNNAGPCPKCNGQLEKTEVSGRTARYCPHCQKWPGG